MLQRRGERLLFVNARTSHTGFASLYPDILQDDAITQQALCALLSDQHLFGAAEHETLEALLACSVEDQQAVTDQLGRQVRTAVELLVQAIDRCDRESGGALLLGIDATTVYQATLSVMMRLCFLLCAEERGLLLCGQDLCPALS